MTCKKKLLKFGRVVDGIRRPTAWRASVGAPWQARGKAMARASKRLHGSAAMSAAAPRAATRAESQRVHEPCIHPCMRARANKAHLLRFTKKTPLLLLFRFAFASLLSRLSHRYLIETHTKHGDFHPDTLFRLFPILTSPIEHPRRDGGARMTEDALVFQTQRPSAPRFDVFRRFGALQGALR